jgi:hypothetical protein
LDDKQDAGDLMWLHTNSRNYYTPTESAKYEKALGILPDIISNMNNDVNSPYKKNSVLSKFFSEENLKKERD